MNLKKQSEYIGVFLVSFGISMLALALIPQNFINAKNLTSEEVKSIESSSLQGNYTIDTYREMMKLSQEKSKSCLIEDTGPEPNQKIVDYVMNKNRNETLCLIKSNNYLDRIKKETEMEQILETYRMMNYYFELINSTLETAVEEVKETVRYREEYT